MVCKKDGGEKCVERVRAWVYVGLQKAIGREKPGAPGGTASPETQFQLHHASGSNLINAPLSAQDNHQL